MTLSSPHLRSMPTDEILAGLARLHPFVFVAEPNGDVSWMNDRLRAHLNGDANASVPKQACLAKLCQENGDVDICAANGTQKCVKATVVDVRAPGEAESSCVVVARPLQDDNSALRPEPTTNTTAQILEHSPDGVVVADNDGFITYVNSVAVSFLARGREELIGRPVATFLANSPDFGMLIEKLREPVGWNGVVFELQRGERSLWLSASTRTVVRDGKTVGVTTYLQDVTQRHLIEDELKQKNHELESTIDSVAHDLRSPLLSLLGFARLLKEDFGKVLDETGLHYLDRVEQAGRTMDGLIHDLLELSRIREPGEMRMSLDPRGVLQQLAAELKLRLDEHGVELALPVAPPMLYVDATRLYQLFSNLIGNAIAHAFREERPQPNARVRIEIHENGSEHEIVVSDNGCGIAEEDRERIFEIFQTGRGVRRDEHSHGMGLAIVKKIATSHGGRVWVESAPEQGARFHVVFPRH